MRTKTFLTILLLHASIAAATQFQAFDRREQVSESDAILVGRVLSVGSAWDDGATGIHTDAEVSIEEVWKGLPGSDRVTVRSPGGSVDDVEFSIEGAPTFRVGERVLLFLSAAGDAYRPFGMRFGKYTIEDTGAGEFLVGNLPPAVTGTQQFEAVSLGLDELRDEVRSILEGSSR